MQRSLWGCSHWSNSPENGLMQFQCINIPSGTLLRYYTLEWPCSHCKELAFDFCFGLDILNTQKCEPYPPPTLNCCFRQHERPLPSTALTLGICWARRMTWPSSSMATPWSTRCPLKSGEASWIWRCRAKPSYAAGRLAGHDADGDVPASGADEDRSASDADGSFSSEDTDRSASGAGADRPTSGANRKGAHARAFQAYNFIKNFINANLTVHRVPGGHWSGFYGLGLFIVFWDDARGEAPVIQWGVGARGAGKMLPRLVWGGPRGLLPATDWAPQVSLAELSFQTCGSWVPLFWGAAGISFRSVGVAVRSLLSPYLC